jgi:hypothetical protein
VNSDIKQRSLQHKLEDLYWRRDRLDSTIALMEEISRLREARLGVTLLRAGALSAQGSKNGKRYRVLLKQSA